MIIESVATSRTHRLEAIKARLTAASPGPWRVWDGFESILRPGKVGTQRMGDSAGSRVLEARENEMYATAADWEFIMKAREDVAWLVGQLEIRRAL